MDEPTIRENRFLILGAVAVAQLLWLGCLLFFYATAKLVVFFYLDANVTSVVIKKSPLAVPIKSPWTKVTGYNRAHLRRSNLWQWSAASLSDPGRGVAKGSSGVGPLR